MIFSIVFSLEDLIAETSSFCKMGCWVEAIAFEWSVESGGKVPLPFNSQYRFTSGKVLITFNTNSKLGLFRPDSRWEILDRCTLILSAKTEADKS